MPKRARRAGGGLPFSQMKCNQDEERDKAKMFLMRMAQNPENISIGTRTATEEQVRFLRSLADPINIVLSQGKTSSDDWVLMHNGAWTGFVYKFTPETFYYVARDGKEFPVSLPAPNPEPNVTFELSGCDMCGDFPASTWHGRCIACERPGCFCPDGLVTLKNGSAIRIDELSEGDEVASQAGFSKILKILVYTGRTHKICNINGLRLTHKHPVLWKGSWTYPKHIAYESLESFSGPVYNFVMHGTPADKTSHTIVVNDIVCATLGCGPCEHLKTLDPEGDRLYGSGFWCERDV